MFFTEPNNREYWINNQDLDFCFEYEPDWMKMKCNNENEEIKDKEEDQVSMKCRKREKKNENKEISSDDEMTPDSKDLNRIRAKRNRRRKKTFYEHLEMRNKFLEHENRKLHNQVKEIQLENSKLIMGNNQEEKEYFKKYCALKNETCSDNDYVNENKSEGYDSSQNKETIRQIKILKCCFSTIISNILSRKQQWLLSELDSDIKENPNDFKRFMKMAKFQKHDYFEENNLSQSDEMLANMNPSKRQLHIFKNFFQPEFHNVKDMIKSGLENLFKAQDDLLQASFKMDSLMEYNIESNIFNIEEINKAVECIKQNNYEATVSLNRVLGITKEARQFEFSYRRQCVRASENSKFAKKMYKYRYETDVFRIA